MANNNIKFNIKLSVDGKEQIVEASMATNALTDKLKKAGRAGADFKRQVHGFNEVTRAFGNLNAVVANFAATTGKMVEAYQVQEVQETKLATVMRERMDATDAQIESIKKLTAAQQELGVIGDEVQLAGAQQLATFLKQKESLATLIPAMNNLIAQQKGLNATGEDAYTIGNLFGKAMQGQASALRRVGISFNAAQEEVLKYGTESEKAAMLAKIITDNVGNMNEELAKTPSGRIKQLANRMGDMLEVLGKTLAPFQSQIMMVSMTTMAFTSLAQVVPGIRAVSASMVALGNATKINAAASWVGTRATTIFTAALGTTATASTITTVAVTALTWAVRALLAAFGIGVVIQVLNMALGALAGASSDAAAKTDELTKAQEEARQEQEQEQKQMARVRGELEANITKLKTFKGSKKEEKKIVEELNNTYGETMGYFSSVADWYEALTKNSKMYCRQMLLEARIRRNTEKQVTAEEDLKKYEAELKKNPKKKELEGPTLGAYVGDFLLDWVLGDDYFKNKYRISTGIYIDNPKYKSALTARNDAAKLVAELKKQNEADAKELADLKMPVHGADTRPDISTSKSGKTTTKAAPDYMKVKPKNLPEAVEALDVLKKKHDEVNQNLPKEQFEAQKKAIADRIAWMEKLCQKYAIALGVEKDYMQVIPENSDEAAEALEKLNAAINAIKFPGGIPTEEQTAFIGKVQERIGILEKLKDRYDIITGKKLPDYVPGDISQLNTEKDLSKAVEYYRNKQEEQSGMDIADTQATINALNKKQANIDTLKELPALRDLTKELGALDGKQLKMRLEVLGISEITDNVKKLKELLQSSDMNFSEEQRKELAGLVSQWEQYSAAAQKSQVSVLDGWDKLRGVGDGIKSLSSALEGGKDAWTTFTSVIDSAIQIFQSIAGIVTMVNDITKAHEKSAEGAGISTAANIADAAATNTATAAKVEQTAATVALYKAQVKAATAGALASAAVLPFPANLKAMAASVLAVQAGMMTANAAFANGGIVGGNSPTGDRLLVRVNSGEMILNRQQQARMFRMLNSRLPLPNAEYRNSSYKPEAFSNPRNIAALLEAPTVRVTGTMRTRGRDMVTVLENETRLASRAGRKTKTVW